MTVTAATGEDVAVVADLWVELAREQRKHDSHLLAEPNRQAARDLVAQYVHAEGCAVARRAGRHVGFVMYHLETGMYKTDSTRGVVDNLYVVPDMRNQGVGSALLDRAEFDLREDGADVLAVEALWANDAARRLYERRGYEPHRVTYEQSAKNDTHSKDGT